MLTHGTYNAYNNHRCRCPECKQAASEYQKERNERNRIPCPGGCGALVYNRGKNTPICRECDLDRRGRAQHGTEGRYIRHGCRCEACRHAAAEARKWRRHQGQVRTHNRSGYCNGCRCDVCRAAHRDYRRECRKEGAR